MDRPPLVGEDRRELVARRRRAPSESRLRRSRAPRRRGIEHRPTPDRLLPARLPEDEPV
jgi:hypothetical protein